MSEKITVRKEEDKTEKTIENDGRWTTLSILRWKYIADFIALLIISQAIITYTYIDKSLPQWFIIITIMASFWVFFPGLYKEYLDAKSD